MTNEEEKILEEEDITLEDAAEEAEELQEETQDEVKEVREEIPDDVRLDPDEIRERPVMRDGGLRDADHTEMIQTHLDNFLAKIAGETPIDDNPRNSTEFWLNEIAENLPGGGTTVVANPETTGTEEELTALQVGETKYLIPSGGSGGVYEHHLKITYNHASGGAGDPARYARIYLIIKTEDNTPITTISALNSVLADFNYLHELMATGYYKSGTDAYSAPVLSCYYDGTALTVEVLYFTNSGSSFQAFAIDDTNAYTITDVVK